MIQEFIDKKLLITGGTGSFATALIKKMLHSDFGEIRVFSRDEKKQDDLRRKYQSSRIKFIVGDVRDIASVADAVKDVDYIFHAAALKQVPSCEFFPMQAVKTNIIGTENVLTAAIQANVKKVVCLSTDKAVYPINAMGISKAMMEKIFVAKSRESSKTIICGTRYGNVMASRGSVIPLFTRQCMDGGPLTITNPSMTRFMMTLEHAVELVLFAFQNGGPGDIFVQKSPAATIETLSKAITEILNKQECPINILGSRHGEKLFEVLVSKEEMQIAEDLGDYYKIKSDSRDLNYEKYFSQGISGGILDSKLEEYNSHNTTRLNVAQTIKLIRQLPEFAIYEAGQPIEFKDA